MKRAIIVAALLALAWNPARAGEVFAGVLSHGAKIGITDCCYEGGADIEIGARSAPVFSLGRYGDFRFYALGSVNTAGGVNFAAAGLAWQISLGRGFYLHGGLAPAVQNGPAEGYQARPHHLYLGSRFLFQPEGAIGYQVSPRWVVEASYVHLSHAQLAGPQNPGLDDLGVRALYRWGR